MKQVALPRWSRLLGSLALLMIGLLFYCYLWNTTSDIDEPSEAGTSEFPQFLPLAAGGFLPFILLLVYPLLRKQYK